MQMLRHGVISVVAVCAGVLVIPRAAADPGVAELGGPAAVDVVSWIRALTPRRPRIVKRIRERAFDAGHCI